MEYWQNVAVATGLSVAVLLLVSEAVRSVFPVLRRLGIPASIVAGVVGLLCGPDLLDVLPLDREVLETVVYHGLAVVFISMGLQTPEKRGGGVKAGVKSFTFAIPFMQASQLVVGLLVVLLLGLVVGEAVHPGFGAMLPLGYENGPGQALSIGSAWEQAGMADGAQVGLIVAALGFAWSVFVGVPLVVWGRKRGLIATPAEGDDDAEATEQPLPTLAPGALELLTIQAIAIAGCYAVTWAICTGLSKALASMPDIAAVVWGFHFILGLLVAMAVRPLLHKLPGGTVIHGPTMGRVSSFAVDVMTCAALAAVQIGVLRANWVPLVLVTAIGGLFTLALSLWLVSRAFPDAPFEHAVVWFGMSTGTLPMGLALLRIIDPDLKSPAPMGAALGSATAIPLSAVVMLLLVPGSVASWPGSYPAAGWVWLGGAFAYVVALLLAWRFLGPLRFRGPLTRFWVARSEEDPS